MGQVNREISGEELRDRLQNLYNDLSFSSLTEEVKAVHRETLIHCLSAVIRSIEPPPQRLDRAAILPFRA